MNKTVIGKPEGPKQVAIAFQALQKLPSTPKLTNYFLSNIVEGIDETA